MLVDGIICTMVQFYYYFMGPIQIAINMRKTQERTPAGTIVGVTQVCSFVFSKMLEIVIREVHMRVKDNGKIDIQVLYLLQRVTTVILYTISFFIIYKYASQEYSIAKE